MTTKLEKRFGVKCDEYVGTITAFLDLETLEVFGADWVIVNPNNVACLVWTVNGYDLAQTEDL